MWRKDCLPPQCRPSASSAQRLQPLPPAPQHPRRRPAHPELRAARLGAHARPWAGPRAAPPDRPPPLPPPPPGPAPSARGGVRLRGAGSPAGQQPRGGWRLPWGPRAPPSSGPRPTPFPPRRGRRPRPSPPAAPAGAAAVTAEGGAAPKMSQTAMSETYGTRPGGAGAGPSRGGGICSPSFRSRRLRPGAFPPSAFCGSGVGGSASLSFFRRIVPSEGCEGLRATPVWQREPRTFQSGLLVWGSVLCT